MKLNCDIVADLLPGYLDNTCSAESRRAVEAHLKECETCRMLLENLKNEAAEELPALNEAEVLQKTSWAIGKRAVGAAAGVTAIVLYWLIYFWQDHLADWGDYRFFSYNFHEIWVGLGLMVVPAVTFLWLAAVLRRCIRQKTWRKNAVLLCALALIVSAQTAWFASQRDQWETHAAGTVEIVDEQHIRLKNKGEVVVELAVPPSVKNLLVEDTVVYNVVYTHQANDRHNDYGTCRLQYITAIDLPPEYFN
ncbi:MAG: zf-HC2 domain-containing protein [Ruminococcaceae bacterium]|nr:zf-HC2 domain-containing protein [Oscillospiraceae bacterium]